MTDDRSIERAARSWLEDGPTQAPDHAVEAALLTIQSTTQERDLLPWRTRRMTQTLRLLAGAAAIAVVVGGMILLRPGSGPGVGGQPTPIVTEPSASAPPTPCGLVSNEEAATAAQFPDVGARNVVPAGRAGTAGTTCTYLSGNGDVIMDVTYTNPGGRVAFASAKGASGTQVVSGIGTDAIFNPATGTLTIAKGDVMVAFETRAPAQAPASALVAIAKLVAGRI